MSAPREELLVYGYIKEYHRSNDLALPPNDLILLFVSWIRFLDSFDRDKCHGDIEFHPDNDKKFKGDHINFGGVFASVAGKLVVEKGMKESWTLKMQAQEVMICIMDDTKI